LSINRYNKLLKSHIENCFIYYFILSMTLIIGIIVGAIVVKIMSENAQLSILKYGNPYFYGLFYNNLDKTYIFKISILFNIVFVLITYIFGILNISFLIPFFYLFKGGVLGIVVGYIIHNYSGKGFVISFLGIYPQHLIYIPLIIIIGSISMTMGQKVKFNSGKRVKVTKSNIFDYTIIIFVLTIFLLLGSLYEGFLAPFFLNILQV